MDSKELVRAFRAGRVSRREFQRTLAGLGIVMTAAPMVPRGAKAAGEADPLVFTWSGYEEEGFHSPYIDKYGESPNYSFFGDEEEAFAKIRAGFTPDIVMPCSYKIPQWHDAGILAPIDTSRLSNWNDLIPALKEVKGTEFDGKPYWVCMDWAQTSVIYRTDLVDIEEESWGLLWDERYKGRLAMIDSLIDGVMVAAIYGGAEDPFDMSDAEVEKTKQLLREQLPLLRFYSNDMTSVQQALASGEIVAGVTWNDSYLTLKDQGLPVKWMQPKEGAMTWTCGIALMKDADAGKMDRTYDMIDAMLSPEAGEYEVMNWAYGHSNAKAYENISADDMTARGLPSDPSKINEFLSAGIFQEPIANEPELQQMFEEVKAGL